MIPGYSNRLEWSTSRNALTEAVEKRRAAGEKILDLTQSNPTAAGIGYPPLVDLLADKRTLLYQPSARGLFSAREAISEYYAGTVSPDRILLTASTSEAYSYLFKLLCDPGDEIFVPRPSYPLFEMLARLECVRVSQYSLHYDNCWFVDLHALKNSITNRTRAIVWVNPNNPTGSFIKRGEYSSIAQLCSQHGLAFIADEVFADYPLEVAEDAVRTFTGLDECLSFSLSGLSKVCGLPQMKLGWLVAGGPGHAEALDRLDWIADTFLSVSSPVQFAAPGMLAARHSIQQSIRERTAANLAFLRAAVLNTPCAVLRVEGGWYATIQVPRTRTEEEWTLHLLQEGVLAQPGFFFDFESEAFLVLSLLTESTTFQQGVRHILNAC